MCSNSFRAVAPRGGRAASCVCALAAAFLPSAQIRADEIVFGAVWIGGSGNWSNPNNWIIPTPAWEWPYRAIFIDLGNPAISTVTVDVNPQIDSLEVDALDSMIISNGRLIWMSGSANANTIHNGGVIRANATSFFTGLIAGDNETLTISGGGRLELNHPTLSRIIGQFGGETLVNEDHVIAGQGMIGGDRLALNNGGVISADVAFGDLTVDPNDSGIVNSGTLQAIGFGRLLLLDCTIDNHGGLIRAADNARIDLDGSAISGGMLATAGNGVLRVHASPASIDDLSVDGVFEVGPTALTMQGSIFHDGMMLLVADATLNPPPTAYSEIILPPGSGDVTLGGLGALDMVAGRIHSGVAGQNGGRLVHQPMHALTGGGMIGMDTVSVFNRGTIIADRELPLVFDPADDQPMVNEGALVAAGEGGIFLSDGTFENDGLVEVRDGSRLISSAGLNLVNNVNSTLIGGVWRVAAEEGTALLALTGQGILTNQAIVELSGANASFALINPMNVNAGDFSLRNGRDFNAVGPFFHNSGNLTIGVGCAFHVSGSFAQDAAGVLRLELGGPDVGGGKAVLTSTGGAQLAGALHLTVQNGYEPQSGDQMHLIAAASISGAFANVVAPAGFTVNYSSTDVIVSFNAPCPADVDGDGVVGVNDLLALIGQWGACPPPPQGCVGDLNHSMIVDVVDLLAVVGAWGDCP